MLFGLNKKDLIYLAVLIALTFTLLTIFKDTTIVSYQRLAQLKLQQQLPLTDLTYLPVFLGIAQVLAFYFPSRILFKLKPFPLFVASVLMVTSSAFTNNFAAGNISEPVLLLLGQFVSPMLGISLAKLADVLFLLPLALFAAYLLLVKKGKRDPITVAVILVSVILPFIYPLAALPFLAALSAYSLGHAEEKKTREEMILGALLVMAITIYLIGFTVQKIALSVFAGVLVAVVMYTLTFRKKLNVAFILVLFFLSIQASTINISLAAKLDQETSSALAQLKALPQNSRITVVSSYLENISAPAQIIADRQVSYIDGFTFLFSAANTTPSFDYLLFDTLSLDSPKTISAATGAQPKFETFMFSQTGMQNQTKYIVFVSTKNYMMMPADNQNNPIGTTVYIGGDEESFYRLVELVTEDSRYVRFIHPRTDSDMNFFKLLFPDKFGQFASFNATQVWQSNSSRMQLYKFQGSAQ